ncbi:MAG TPA: hypothetical protein VJJ83_02705, partial [Candidatus Babeliales bacterium]|nr:hypothetical protein [Candidatus Babeliales bacterium]
IIFFQRLTESDVAQIAKLQLQELLVRLREQGFAVEIEPAVITKIAELGFTPEFGARPLKRAIQQQIVVPLSQAILKQPTVKQLTVKLVHDKIVVA